MLQFLKVFLDIVLWRRGPQDLPASRLLLWLSVGAYVAVTIVQLAQVHETSAKWWVFVVADPALLVAGTWLLLGLFGKRERFLQTATAVLGTGALLGALLVLPVQWLMATFGIQPNSTPAGIAGLGLVVAASLVTGRIIQLATDSTLYTGIALSLMYFLLINLLLGIASGSGGH